MAVPVHMKVVFRGEFTGSPETFSFGMHFSRDNALGDDAHVSDIHQDQVRTALGTLCTTAAAGIPNGCRFTDWRAYEIGPDGRMENNPLIDLLPLSGFTGTSAVKYPPQVALVVTTVAANRGPGRFGRFYLPTVLGINAADHRLTVAQAQAAGAAAATFMKGIADAIDLQGISTSSEGLNISQSAGGARQTIDHLEVGRALDTLRTRRKALLEDRQATGHIDW